MVSSLLLAVSLAAVGVQAQGKSSPAPFSSGSGLGGLVGGIAQSVVTGTSAVPMGPAPKGCSAYEILVG